MLRAQNNSNKRAIHRTVNGIPVDMEKLRSMNGSIRAVGNANLNARGDRLDSTGRIVKKREDMVNEFYQRKQDGVRYVSLSALDTSTAQVPTPSDNIEFKTLEQIKKDMSQKTLDAPENIRNRKRKLTDEE